MSPLNHTSFLLTINIPVSQLQLGKDLLRTFIRLKHNFSEKIIPTPHSSLTMEDEWTHPVSFIKPLWVDLRTGLYLQVK